MSAPASQAGPSQAEPVSVSSLRASIPSAVTPLQSAIDRGRGQGNLALYFGCAGGLGHFLHQPDGATIWDAPRKVVDFPWSEALMDSGLLKNGKHAEVCDGKVYWTCGGVAFWYAFFWWDRSVDRRGASNSGFYVRGFGWPEAQEAFNYACTAFPRVVARQMHPLVLQEPIPAQAMSAREGQDPQGLGAEPASAVRQDAPNPCNHTPSIKNTGMGEPAASDASASAQPARAQEASSGTGRAG